MGSADIRIELEKVIVDNFTGEYNSLDEVWEMIDGFQKATLEEFKEIQAKIKRGDAILGADE
jgi:hypothetical protein